MLSSSTKPIRFLAFRYLFNRKGGYGFVNVNTSVAVMGICFGMASLIIVLSVFNGFQDMTTETLKQESPKIRVYSPEKSIYKEFADWALFYSKEKIVIQSNDGFTAIDLFSLYSSDTTEYIHKFIQNTGNKYLYQHDGFDSPSISGDGFISYTTLDNLERLAYTGFAGSFNESNLLSAYLPFLPSNTIATLSDSIDKTGSILDYYGNDSDKLEAMANNLNLRYDTWETLNSEILSILKLEKLFSTFVMFMIVCIGFFNLIAAISMLVTVKKMDFHTLGVMGLSDKDNKKIARLFGTAVITIGLVSGLILGISMIFLQNSFGLIAINVEGRFIDNLPMTIEWYQLVLLVFIIFIVGKLFIELPVSQIKNYNLKPNV